MRAMHVSAGIAVIGAIALTIGVFGQFGLWWSLIVAGSLASVSAVILIDVDEPDKEGRR